MNLVTRHFVEDAIRPICGFPEVRYAQRQEFVHEGTAIWELT